MRIVGIDPGTVCCGYGIVEPGRKSKIVHVTSGEIKLNKKTPLQERLQAVYSSLDTVISEYRPEHLCIEKIFYHKSITSAFTLGSVRGIVLLLAAQNGLRVFEYNPTEVKMALTGYGRAEKRQVQEMVKRILALDPSLGRLTEDRTDALALCICHTNTKRLNFEG